LQGGVGSGTQVLQFSMALLLSVDSRLVRAPAQIAAYEQPLSHWLMSVMPAQSAAVLQP